MNPSGIQDQRCAELAALSDLRQAMETMQHNADVEGLEWCLFECFNCSYT